ncbi:DivIVA domain-containing protein [Micromonospora sp. NPDC049799]|uniref:DivIVA domain-containing protein n=1 Tax=Micromonospora sp. NPDC049799 TaxID=3154741 RepID=UPI0033EA2D50
MALSPPLSCGNFSAPRMNLRRERRFPPTRLGRRGLNPNEVYAFLDRLAVDMAAVYDALARSRRETAVVKDALRRWRSEQAEGGRRCAGDT